MTFGGKKQNFNQSFSSRLAAVTLRLKSIRHKLELSEAMLGDFLTNHHPDGCIPAEFRPEMKEIAISIDQLKITEQALREFNKAKILI